MEIFDQDIQLASYGGDEEPEKYTYEHFRPIDVHLKVPSTRRCTDIGGPPATTTQPWLGTAFMWELSRQSVSY